MRFACQSCGKAYNLPEEKIAEKTNVKLKCRVCGAIVEVKRQGEIVAQLLAAGKRVGRISEAPAPLASFAPGDTLEPGAEFDDNDDTGVAVAPMMPTFNLTGSTNIGSPPPPSGVPAVRAPSSFESAIGGNINPEPPLPAWSREEDAPVPPPPERVEERARMASPPALSPPPVLPTLPRMPQESVSNGAVEHTNGQSTRLRAVEQVSNPATPAVGDTSALTSATDRFPVVPPVARESGSDVKGKMMAALITGLILGFILARLLQ